jgi:hypothetical protein
MFCIISGHFEQGPEGYSFRDVHCFHSSFPPGTQGSLKGFDCQRAL